MKRAFFRTRVLASGNGTEEIVKALVPRVEEAKIHTHFCSGTLQQVRRGVGGGVGGGGGGGDSKPKDTADLASEGSKPSRRHRESKLEDVAGVPEEIKAGGREDSHVRDNNEGSFQEGQQQRCLVAGGLGTQPKTREVALMEEVDIHAAGTLPLGDATGANRDSSTGKQTHLNRSFIQGAGDAVEAHKREGIVTSVGHVPTPPVKEGVRGPRDRAATLPADIDHDGDDGDAQPAEEWSAQFRDKRLAEHDVRRDALLRELLSPTSNEGNSPTATMTTTAAEGESGGTTVPSTVRRCHSATGAVPSTKRGTGRSRYGNGRGEESGVGATLGEFKASVGLSAKGELFDDLFCRPSRLDEALTTEPGRRTPQQASLKLRVQACTPSFIYANPLKANACHNIPPIAGHWILLGFCRTDEFRR